jgi:hypothetical protein
VETRQAIPLKKPLASGLSLRNGVVQANKMTMRFDHHSAQA